jgi:hypothetical protein
MPLARCVVCVMPFSRVLLLIVCYDRYVDDFFSADRKESVRKASQVFYRLVECLLGPGSCAKDKLMYGNPLTVLGVDITLTRLGALMKPSADKVVKWVCRIQQCIQKGLMTSGEASKLAGALQWASQHMFKRLGRAMIRPIIRHRLLPLAPSFRLVVRACAFVLGKSTGRRRRSVMSCSWRSSGGWPSCAKA